MLKFTITGDVPSKKNSFRIINNKKTGKPFILSSVAKGKWHNRAISQLLENRPNLAIARGNKLILEMTFYSETARAAALDNKATTVLDLLQEAGIIENDNWNVIPKLILEYGGKDKNNPRCEITINSHLDD